MLAISVNGKVLAAAATMLLLVTGAGLASGTTPASASPGRPAVASSGHEVCDEGSPLECLNAWGGGPSIRTYTPAVSNNNFTVQGVDRCNNGDYSTSNCPITGNPSGLYIYQIKYAGGGPYNGQCVGDNTGQGYGEMVNCNSTSYPGTGGGYATIFVAYPGNGVTMAFCDSGFNYGVNAHYTNLSGGWANGFTGIAYHNQTDVLVAVAGVPIDMQCLSYTPFG